MQNSALIPAAVAIRTAEEAGIDPAVLGGLYNDLTPAGAARAVVLAGGPQGDKVSAAFARTFLAAHRENLVYGALLQAIHDET